LANALPQYTKTVKNTEKIVALVWRIAFKEGYTDEG